MVKWTGKAKESTVVVQASSCSTNKGLSKEDRSEQQSQDNIYVNVSMTPDIKLQALVEAMETMSVISIGVQNLMLRPNVVAMYKRLKLSVRAFQNCLGLPWNTRDLTVEIISTVDKDYDQSSM